MLDTLARPLHCRPPARIALFCLIAFAIGCAATPEPAAAAGHRVDGDPVVFSLIDLDGAVVSSDTTRGRATVLLFFTSYDMGSQLMARRLNDLLKARAPRFNVVAIALEPPKNAVLVGAFRESLGLGYPVAIADRATREGRGPFAKVHAVPAVMIVDPRGREVWFKDGAASEQELREALEKADGGRKALRGG